jgi:recombination protein RecA
MEQSFDWEWAKAHGLNPAENKFFHVYPDNSEDVSDQIKEMANSGLFSHIVVDSIGGMESQKAFEKGAEESNMGKNAQIITRMTKALAVNARKNGVYVLLINQVRANFASPTGGDTFSGPKNLKHATTMSVRFGRTGEPPLKIRENGEEIVVGKEIRARVERSKVAAEGRSTTFWIINYPTKQHGPIGIDKFNETVNIGQLSGIISRAGAYYSLPDGTRHMGGEKMKEHLRQNPELVDTIREMAIATRKGEIIPDDPDVQFVPEMGTE